MRRSPRWDRRPRRECWRPPSGTLDTLTDDDWELAFNITLMSAVRLVRSAIPYLKQRPGGAIVLCTSLSVRAPVPNLMLSNTIRTGLIGFMKTLVTELAPYGIRINSAAPGRFLTSRIEELDRARAKTEGRSVEEIREKDIRGIPAGRIGDPAEFRDVVAFLCSPRASYINGATVMVDGGKTLAYP